MVFLFLVTSLGLKILSHLNYYGEGEILEIKIKVSALITNFILFIYFLTGIDSSLKLMFLHFPQLPFEYFLLVC